MLKSKSDWKYSRRLDLVLLPLDGLAEKNKTLPVSSHSTELCTTGRDSPTTGTTLDSLPIWERNLMTDSRPTTLTLKPCVAGS